MEINARHYISDEPFRLRTEGGMIVEVSPSPEIDLPEPWDAPPAYVSPAFWDIQFNGRWGISFADPTLTVDSVARIILAQAGFGVARCCPTLITAPHVDLVHGLKTIAEACETIPDVGRRVVGIHLEGPYISPLDGYRGAHPISAVRDPDWSEFETLQAASGGRIVIITLAPERPGACDFIRRAVASGVIVALGHSAADSATIREAVDAGARLSTHLGNGIAAQLPRHPNPIWEQAGTDLLWASLIADGEHLDSATLRSLLRSKESQRAILISDASPLAGCDPGRYGDWEVEPSGRIVVAGTAYLAGSNLGLFDGVRKANYTALSSVQAIVAASINPATLLRRPPPRLLPGEPANFVVFTKWPTDQISSLVGTCVDGEWVEPNL